MGMNTLLVWLLALLKEPLAVLGELDEVLNDLWHVGGFLVHFE